MPRNATQRRAVAAALNELWAMDEQKLDQIRGFLELRASGVEIPEASIEHAMSLQAHSVILAMDGGPSQQDNGRFIVDGVEVLSLFGTLAARMNLMMRYSGGTSTQQFGQAFDRAMRDSEVRTIFIEVDSPGGTVTGTDELASKIFAARGKKRVVAVARGMVASAAYYIGSAAEVFAATPSTEGGSIGVYAITRESTDRHAEEGDKYFVWRAGQLKAAGIEYETLSKDRAAALQARVDAPYQMFLDAVARHRGTDTGTVAKDFGQGTVFVASEMLRRGMIDRVDSIETIFEEERSRAASQKQTTQHSSSFALDVRQPFQADGQAAVRQPFQADGQAGKPDVRSPDLLALAGASQTQPQPPAKPTTPKPTVSNTETSTMNPRLKAALFAQGLIASMEASDEVCQAALSGYFRGNVPKSEDEQLAAINGTATTATAPGATGSASAPPSVQAAHDREFAEARREASLQGAQRVLELQARAAILTKTGFAISAAQVDEAVQKDWSVAQAVDAWTKVEGQGADPERPVGSIRAGEAETDKFAAVATDALLLKTLPNLDRSTLAAGAGELAGRRTMDIVRRDMQNRGLTIRGNDEDIASQWLRSVGDFVPMAAGAGRTAADYPNLLAGFVNKRLAAMMKLQSTKYSRWCGQEPSVMDLNPRLVIGQSQLGRLDDIEGDDGPLAEDRTQEKALAWFKVNRKGKKVALTPIMVTQDQLGAFANQYADLVDAADRTINDMAVDLLVSNPTMLDDTTAMFHANHGNLITSGGVPTASGQAKAVRNAMRRQVGIGTSDPIEAEPAIILVPTELYDDALQQYYSFERLNEAKLATTDTAINVHRGTVREVIAEGRLEATSTAAWYAFADPLMWPVIKYVFQSGYEGGKRRSWYDADRDTRYFGLESRVAVFAAGWRGAVQNDGVT
jgi:signal peptide peptidase SppA